MPLFVDQGFGPVRGILHGSYYTQVEQAVEDSQAHGDYIGEQPLAVHRLFSAHENQQTELQDGQKQGIDHKDSRQGAHYQAGNREIAS